MLTTGVDIPAIEMVVFMRMVKSRILWVQMLGRGTRLCPEINKEKFTIFDCFDGSLIEYFKNATDFNVTLQQETVPFSEIIERIYDNRDREYNTKRLIKRLRRIEKNMGAEAREKIAEYIPDGDIKAYADKLKENIDKKFTDDATPAGQGLSRPTENYPRPQKVFFKGYDIVDTVIDQVMFRVGSDYQKPDDYLKLFEQFVKENPEQIEAIEMFLQNQRNGTPMRWKICAKNCVKMTSRKKIYSEGTNWSTRNPLRTSSQ